MRETGGFDEPDVIFIPPQQHDWLNPGPELGQFVTVAAGTNVCRQGDSIDCVWYVLEGLLKYATTSENGEAKILGLLTKGCLFGEGPVLFGRPIRMGVVAIQESTLLVIPRVKLLSRLVEDPTLAVPLVQSMGDKIYAFSRQIEQLSFLEPSSRIVNLLLALHRRTGSLPELTQEQIAEMVGCNRVTVCRILNQLRAKALIAVCQKRITVVDDEGLRALLK